MENSNSLGGARIALLIDFDNVILGIDEPGFDIELVVNALRERGTITVSRVYGDWYRHSRHRRRLMEHGVELVEAPAFGPVIKNSADIKIALDGYEIGMTMPHINTFCLVSGDSDFLPLIKKLQGLGKNVLVICGNRFTSDMLRRNCNEFISYENLLAASYGADEDATTLEGAFALLHRAMAALRERGSEIRTSTLKQMMIQLNPVFSEKTFGYNQFRGFLDKAGREGLIKLGPRDRVSGEFYVLLPEEDEAQVIEQIERAEPAQVVEEIVEARRGNGNNRNRREDKARDEKDERANRRGQEARVEEEPPRPRSRREARLLAQQELEQREAAAPQNALVPAAPLASPLTPATDFSPADASETQQMSISRGELLSRGLRVGKFKFSGAKGIEKIEAPIEAAPDSTEELEARVEPDIALAPQDVEAEVTEAPNAEAEVASTSEAPEKTKRSRSRRRKKTADTTENATTETVETPPAEAAPASVEAEATPASDEPAATPESEAAPVEKKPRRRSRSKAKTEAAPNETVTENSTESEPEPAPVAEAPPEATPAPEKPKRTRRRKKAETPEENSPMNETEKAVEADGTQHTVSTEGVNRRQRRHARRAKAQAAQPPHRAQTDRRKRGRQNRH